MKRTGNSSLKHQRHVMLDAAIGDNHTLTDRGLFLPAKPSLGQRLGTMCEKITTMTYNVTS